MPDLIGQSLGRYHILEQLGEGGMATVYKAHDTTLERNVAVKVIRRGAFPLDQMERMLMRFEREAKSLAKLSHPNIVKVLDYGEHEGAPYIVMEFLPGGTLKEKLGGTRLSWQESVRLLLPITQALAYAHTNNIIHRDIKPANILITQSGEPMLSDFGIAKILEGEKTNELTATGAGIGTPEYMAPEQALGQTDARVDIYALGVVLYQMITGQVPFRADTPMAVLLKKSQEPLPRPKQFIASLPDAVESVLIKILARDPANRFQTTRELVIAFQHLLESGQTATVEVNNATKTLSTNDTLPAVQTRAPRRVTEAVSISTAKRSNKWIWIGAGGLVLVTCVGIGLYLASNLTINGSPVLQATQTLVESAPATMSADEAAIATKLSFPTLVPSTVFVQPVGDSSINPNDKAELAFIPAGEFLMGSDSNELYFWGAEYPKHKVYLNAFSIYRTEVTNFMYRVCLEAKACPYPEETSSNTHGDYFYNPQFDNYPVIHVTYDAAVSYCVWVGARLPTEAEWEKAARGTDGRLYPWGNDAIQNDLANFCDVGCPNSDSHEIEVNFNDGFRDVAPVGSFPLGASPFGVLDMAGNVLEWVSDWYSTDYYSVSPYENPLGADSGTRHPIRGGSWFSGREGLRPAARASLSPTSSYDTLGFRCALTAP